MELINKPIIKFNEAEVKVISDFCDILIEMEKMNVCLSNQEVVNLIFDVKNYDYTRESYDNFDYIIEEN